jgi:hypothetical protein
LAFKPTRWSKLHGVFAEKLLVVLDVLRTHADVISSWNVEAGKRDTLCRSDTT